MPIATSSRLLIFGGSLPIRKLSAFSMTTWLHRGGGSITHRTNRRHHNTLTLATIGVERSERNEPKRANPRSESPKSKKPARRTTVTKPPPEMGAVAAPFSAASFSDLGLPAGLVQRLEDEGFATPTDVQSAAIPAILSGRDAVIQSYTGSGKTLAYLLPILAEFGNNNNNNNKNGIGAVIVAPSRELGMQIVREVEKILGPDNKRAVQQLVGGANRARQEEALKKNKPEIVVGTPGRIAEISSSGRLHTHECRYLVLDEVDELLSFNFREDMHRILEHVGKKSGSGSGGPGAKRVERRTVLVSATVPFSVVRAARSWADDPLLVRAESIGPLEPAAAAAAAAPATVQSLPPNLRHYYSVARAQHKVDALRRCVHALEAKSVIAFMNHTRRLKDAVFKLEARGVGAAELHGDLGKLARSATLRRFRAGEVRVLVTNELSARGLDVAECDLVVNLDLPTDPVHYAHRAGRTGRLGRVGTVVTMCEESEVFVVKKIQKQLSVAIPCCEFVEGELVVTEEDKPLSSS